VIVNLITSAKSNKYLWEAHFCLDEVCSDFYKSYFA